VKLPVVEPWEHQAHILLRKAGTVLEPVGEVGEIHVVNLCQERENIIPLLT
jgi:hypothetical protein